ncbi:MAG: pseudouridine synthase [Phocaeicola sp.]
MLHPFTTSIDTLELPQTFVNPFCDSPHPICQLAAQEVENYLRQQTAWHEELNKGKMLGVLVVRSAAGEIGFLAAFSGLLAGKNRHPYFVPPVYDFLQPNHYFQQEVAQISAINERVDQLEKEIDVEELKQLAKQREEEQLQELASAKAILKEQKRARNTLRKSSLLTPAEEEQLVAESQRQKGIFTRLERAIKEQVVAIKAELEQSIHPIESLKQERKKRSAALQEYLFNSFTFLNKAGEEKALSTIFQESPLKTPPAGAGECAGPKLLQYAYLHQLDPVALAEFWWGESPKQEIRHHGYFYPPCKGKCEPIFGHMLQGWELAGETGPQQVATIPLTVLYEDEEIVAVNKPAGMLSVPGKEPGYSVYQWMKDHYPQATGPLIIHRLDMATSGILLLAKNKDIHKSLQELFATRTIKKRYVALLEGYLVESGCPISGEIALPLSMNILDRPRQMVDEIAGKPALTHYQLMGSEERIIPGKEPNIAVTRVQLYPHTGRTHQLRIHSAHAQGLNSPILGDALYGKVADRLYLHAEQLEFTHPTTGEKMTIVAPADF